MEEVTREKKRLKNNKSPGINIPPAEMVKAGGNNDILPTTNHIMLNDEPIEIVKEFEYLGSLITNTDSSSEEIKRRLGIAKSSVIQYTKIWKYKIRTSTKLRLLRATAFSIATYDAESWTYTKADCRRTDAFEHWSYRRVLRVPWVKKINE